MKDTIAKKLQYLKNIRIAEKSDLEGISFRYKTVQFHLIDDTFEEIERHPDTFGGVKIFSERFSLPGYGSVGEGMTGNEFQFEVIANIESKTGADSYYTDLEKALDKISKKHDVEILIEPYEPEKDPGTKNLPPDMQSMYNLHKITFYTDKDGVFPKE